MFLTPKWRAILLPLFLFVIVVSLYIHHLSPSVYGGDVGDLVTAITVLGVPHPPGYPLYTLLGILFNALPFNEPPAWKIGLISAIAAAGAVVVLYLIVTNLLKSKLLGIIAALTLGFYYLFWLYAEVAELFALNYLISLTLIYLGILYYTKKKKLYLYLLSFFLGITLTHHHFSILLFPSIGIIVLATDWRIIKKPKLLLKCFLLFALGLLPYLYVPLAASDSPPINWNNASTLNNFLHLVLRKDYSINVNTDVDFTMRFLSLKAYALDVLFQLTPAVVGLSFLGMVALLLKRKFILFFYFFLAFFFSGPFFFVYSSTQIQSVFTQSVVERFYGVSVVFLILFFPFGITFLLDLVTKVFTAVSTKKRIVYYRYIFLGVFLIIPILLFKSNFSKTDLHAVWMGDYLGYDILASVPKKSVVFLANDTTLFNSLYMKYSLGMREDVEIVNFNRLGDSTLFMSYKKRILQKEKKIRPEDVDLRTIIELSKDRDVFSISTIKHSDPTKNTLKWVPYGLLLKLDNERKFYKDEETFAKQQGILWGKLHLPDPHETKKFSQRNLTLVDIPSYYAQAAVNTANQYISAYGNAERAKEYFQKAIDLYPNGKNGYFGLGYYYLNKNDCREAERYFDKTIELAPGDKSAYVLLFATYEICSKDRAKMEALEKEFSDKFNTSIFSELKKKINELKKTT